jgi:aminoglycoside 3-N-acetyltransferase
MLGAPLDTVTLLHHAEGIARAPGKRYRTYTVRHATGADRTYTDIDTEHGAYPYDQLNLDDDYLAVIAREALASGIGARGRVAAADCHLFDAAELTAFAVAWLEERFRG